MTAYAIAPSIYGASSVLSDLRAFILAVLPVPPSQLNFEVVQGIQNGIYHAADAN